MHFKDAVDEIAKKFRETSGPVRIISNFDADGITSAAILVTAMRRLKRVFSLSIIKQITEDYLKELSNEEYKTIIIADMGSGSLSLIEKYLEGRAVFVLDHHQMEDFETKVSLLNPLKYGLTDYKEVCAAGVC